MCCTSITWCHCGFCYAETSSTQARTPQQHFTHHHCNAGCIQHNQGAVKHRPLMLSFPMLYACRCLRTHQDPARISPAQPLRSYTQLHSWCRSVPHASIHLNAYNCAWVGHQGLVGSPGILAGPVRRLRTGTLINQTTHRCLVP